MNNDNLLNALNVNGWKRKDYSERGDIWIKQLDKGAEYNVSINRFNIKSLLIF